MSLGGGDLRVLLRRIRHGKPSMNSVFHFNLFLLYKVSLSVMILNYATKLLVKMLKVTNDEEI